MSNELSFKITDKEGNVVYSMVYIDLPDIDKGGDAISLYKILFDSLVQIRKKGYKLRIL